MKLQKLLDAGAFTLGGDVIFFDVRRNCQVKVADWSGGEDVQLTAYGQDIQADFEPPEKLVDVAGFEAPRKGRKTHKEIAQEGAGKDLDLSAFKLDGE